MLKLWKEEKSIRSKKMATYKSAPTFHMDRKDFESYRTQVMLSIKTNRMALMSDGRVLLWIDEELAKLPEEKEDKKKKPIGV